MFGSYKTLIEKFSNTYDNPTSALLHDLILLCQLKGRKTIPALRHYDFHAYMRGPYSEDLRDDLEELYRQHYIEVSKGKLIVTEEGQKLIRGNKKNNNYKTTTGTCQEVLKDFGTAHAVSEGIQDSLQKVSLGDVIH